MGISEFNNVLSLTEKLLAILDESHGTTYESVSALRIAQTLIECRRSKSIAEIYHEEIRLPTNIPIDNLSS